MADLRERVNVEIENISIVLEKLEKIKDKPNKTEVELAGMGTFLHNIYTGIENILKQILSDKRISIPTSDSWHNDLLKLAADKEIITEDTKRQLGKFLAFRHFFIHAYSFMLEESRLDSLIDNISKVWLEFLSEIKNHY